MRLPLRGCRPVRGARRPTGEHVSIRRDGPISSSRRDLRRGYCIRRPRVERFLEADLERSCGEHDGARATWVDLGEYIKQLTSRISLVARTDDARPRPEAPEGPSTNT